jgi:hypothetical protein
LKVCQLEARGCRTDSHTPMPNPKSPPCCVSFWGVSYKLHLDQRNNTSQPSFTSNCGETADNTMQPTLTLYSCAAADNTTQYQSYRVRYTVCELGNEHAHRRGHIHTVRVAPEQARATYKSGKKWADTQILEYFVHVHVPGSTPKDGSPLHWRGWWFQGRSPLAVQ